MARGRAGQSPTGGLLALGPEASIAATALQQLLVRAPLNDAAVLDREDLVGSADG